MDNRYTHEHTHEHACWNVHTHTSPYTHTLIYMHSLHIYIYPYTNTFTHIIIYTYTHSHIFVKCSFWKTDPEILTSDVSRISIYAPAGTGENGGTNNEFITAISFLNINN